MHQFFDDKTHQVEPGALSAFGISLSSRYAKASELIEMLRFAQCAALEGVAHYVKEVFYDSKAGICSFTLDPAVQASDPVAGKLYSAVKGSISQFYWFDSVTHGSALTEPEEA